MNKIFLYIFSLIFLFEFSNLYANRKKKRLQRTKRTYSYSVYRDKPEKLCDIGELTRHCVETELENSPVTPGTPTLGDFFPDQLKFLQTTFITHELNKFIEENDLDAIQIFSDSFLQKICNLGFPLSESCELDTFYPDSKNVFLVAHVIVNICPDENELCQILMKKELDKFFEDITKIFRLCSIYEYICEDWQDQAKEFVEKIFPEAIVLASKESMDSVKNFLEAKVSKLLKIYNPFCVN